MSTNSSFCHALADRCPRRILPRPVSLATLGVTWGRRPECGPGAPTAVHPAATAACTLMVQAPSGASALLWRIG